jgi:hypothetical protein
VPAVSTIWRILSRRGFVIAQPHKRPRSAWKRFEADMPNQRWQASSTTATSAFSTAPVASTKVVYELDRLLRCGVS